MWRDMTYLARLWRTKLYYW